MSASLRKGWCPGALRPMAAKDGLLVRLRITGGVLSAEKAMALADLAERFGNGLFDLSARGNLQIRGVQDASLIRLQDGLATLGLIDDDASGEAVRNVIASPLAGLHEGLDVRPLVAALERRLVSDSALHALPAKFGFLLDDGGSPSPAGVAADVRFDWTAEGFSIGLGGDATEAVRIGWCSAGDLAEEATRIGRRFIGWSARRPDVRRMRDIAAEDRSRHFAKSDACRKSQASQADAAPFAPRKERTDARQVVGWRTDSGPPFLGLAAPFGRLDATMLHRIAAIAAATPRQELRLTPWRAILVPDAPKDVEIPEGFIDDPNDPRLAVAACVGVGGCRQGTTDTHADAALLAAEVARSVADPVPLHVSGCTKGCAKPTPSPLTLVARDGRYDLVRNGRAGDRPWRQNLGLDEVRKLLAAELRTA